MSTFERPVLLPGPDHPITLDAAAAPMRARVGDVDVARSENALLLSEAGYPPIVYFPRADVDASLLTPTDHESYCPYKGEASYFTIATDEAILPNVAWTYEQPHPAMEQIASYVAFYTDQVEVG